MYKNKAQRIKEIDNKLHKVYLDTLTTRRILSNDLNIKIGNKLIHTLYRTFNPSFNHEVYKMTHADLNEFETLINDIEYFTYANDPVMWIV